MLSGRERPTFKLPSYDLKTIYQVLSSRGMEISVGVLEDPKRDATIALLESLLSLVTNVYRLVKSKEDVRQFIVAIMVEAAATRCAGLTPESIDMNEYLPDNGAGYNRAVRLLVLLRVMQRYLGELFGIPVISLNDILNPVPKRVQLFCSALVDYIRFQEEHLGCYLERLSHTEQLQAQLHQLEEQTNEYVGRHAKLELCVKSRQQEKAALAEQMEKNEAVLRQLLARSAELSSEVDSASEVFRSSEDECRLRQEELYRLTAEVANAGSRVVSSPARIVQEMNAAVEQCETEKAAIVALEDRIRDLKLKHGVVEHVRKTVLEAIAATAALGNVQLATLKASRKAEQIQKDVADLQTELKILDRSEKQTRSQNLSLRGELQTLETELEEARRLRTDLVEKIRKRQSVLRSGIEALTLQHRDIEAQENVLSRDCEELTTRICATKEQFECSQNQLTQYAREAASAALAQFKAEALHLQSTLKLAQPAELVPEREPPFSAVVLPSATTLDAAEGQDQADGDEEKENEQ